MNDGQRSHSSGSGSSGAEPGPQENVLDPETQRTLRNRVIQLAFGGDPKRYD